MANNNNNIENEGNKDQLLLSTSNLVLNKTNDNANIVISSSATTPQSSIGLFKIKEEDVNKSSCTPQQQQPLPSQSKYGFLSTSSPALPTSGHFDYYYSNTNTVPTSASTTNPPAGFSASSSSSSYDPFSTFLATNDFDYSNRSIFADTSNTSTVSNSFPKLAATSPPTGWTNSFIASSANTNYSVGYQHPSYQQVSGSNSYRPPVNGYYFNDSGYYQQPLMDNSSSSTYSYNMIAQQQQQPQLDFKFNSNEAMMLSGADFNNNNVMMISQQQQSQQIRRDVKKANNSLETSGEYKTADEASDSRSGSEGDDSDDSDDEDEDDECSGSESDSEDSACRMFKKDSAVNKNKQQPLHHKSHLSAPWMHSGILK